MARHSAYSRRALSKVVTGMKVFIVDQKMERQKVKMKAKKWKTSRMLQDIIFEFLELPQLFHRTLLTELAIGCKN